jgi:hypothetical protein
MGGEGDLLENVTAAYERSRARPRVLLLSFPHNPTTAVVEAEDMQRIVDFARERELIVVHDFAYADIAFDGHVPPSILQAEGASEVAVELYTLTKSFSMAGWRVGFLVGNAAVVQALARLKSYLDYGTFQPIQIAAIVAMNEAREVPAEVSEAYRSRQDALSAAGCPGSAGRWQSRRGRCSSGRRSPSPTVRWAPSNSRSTWRARRGSRSAPGSASGRAATATSASPSSRTNSGSDRRYAPFAPPCPHWQAEVRGI